MCSSGSRCSCSEFAEMVALLGLVLALAACRSAGAPSIVDAARPCDGICPPAAGVLRLATFNLHQFFDWTCDSSVCDGDNFEQRPSQVQVEAQATRVAAGLRSLEVAAVAVEEVETKVALDTLLAKLGPDLTNAAFGETGADGSLDVAVLTRGEIIEVRRHRNEVLYRPDGSTTYFARELLEVHLRIDEHLVIVFAAHFRSKAGDDDPGRRLAEAQAARRICLATAAEHPEALVVLGGDLNDTPGSPPLDALEEAGDLRLLTRDLPADDAWTYAWYGRGQLIDHLLQVVRAGGGYEEGSIRVARDSSDGTFAGSDHAAVYADFVF